MRFLTGSRFARVVEASGAEHVPLPAEADFDDRRDWDAIFPERAGLKGAKAIAFDIEHVFVRPGRPQHDAVMAAHAAEPADVVLTDPAFAGGAFILGHPLGVRPPLIMCGVLPLTISSRDTAPYGMGITPFPGPLGRLRNAVLAGLTGKLFAPTNRSPTTCSAICTPGPHPSPFSTGRGRPRRSSSSRCPSSSTRAPTRRPPSTSPDRSRASGSQAPYHLVARLDGSRPVVHVTQGTVANRDYRQIIAPTLEALADDDVLVVVSTGGRPLDTLPSLPANARAAEFLPYDELLPLTDVYVTNSGYGGVQYALRYGVPVVATSGHEDKPEVAARVAWSGVGRRLNTETPSPAAVRRAVHTVLQDQRYRVTAQHLAHRMAAADGLQQLTEIIDHQIANDAQPQDP